VWCLPRVGKSLYCVGHFHHHSGVCREQRGCVQAELLSRMSLNRVMACFYVNMVQCCCCCFACHRPLLHHLHHEPTPLARQKLSGASSLFFSLPLPPSSVTPSLLVVRRGPSLVASLCRRHIVPTQDLFIEWTGKRTRLRILYASLSSGVFRVFCTFEASLEAIPSKKSLLITQTNPLFSLPYRSVKTSRQE
jgi:hypothetical protein